ncbi:hypothetical protein [Brevibacillus massiliensis]|uniref:hypothetical protein n=1 Tax=Brevibacillus massiliensis TaxID=1118054 RepID=UPI0011C9A219|nr:hypothetical protein [Brevibacillus massiliensis]
MSVTFEQGKRKREELRLPIQHFVVVDDWINKIGVNAYIAWLRFYTWADRSTPDREADVIPMGMKTVAKKLNCSEPTLYKTIIRPLWNYALIDIREVVINRVKHKNIIVYEYPQNDPALATKPLEMVRNYETDYTSMSRVSGQKGGVNRHLSQGCGLKKCKVGGLKNFKQGAKKNLSGVLKKNLAINDIKYLSNVSNNSFHDSNKDSNQSVSLPKEIVQVIYQNQLTDRLLEIESVYNLLRNEPGYTDTKFILTLGKPSVGRIAKEKTAFEFRQYFLSAMHNNIADKQNSQNPRVVSHERNILRDKLPASLIRQLEREKNGENKPVTRRKVIDDPELRALLEKCRSQAIKKLPDLDGVSEPNKTSADPDDRPY